MHLTPYLHVDDIDFDISPTALTARLGEPQAHDGEAFERAGFVVSPRWGLAFAPDCPDWVTALASHCIPTWRAL